MSTWSIERHDAVALMTFTRPPDNLMDFGSMIELGDRLKEFAQRTDEVKAIIVDWRFGYPTAPSETSQSQ